MNKTSVVATSREERAERASSTGWQRVRIVFILGALSAFGPLSIDMYLPSLPSLSHDLGASASLAQLTLSFCLLGLALGQIIAGPLSDTLGRLRPLIVGVGSLRAGLAALCGCSVDLCADCATTGPRNSRRGGNCHCACHSARQI